MNEKTDPSRTSDADRSEDRVDARSSLARLAEFTRRILKISKSDLPIPKG